MTEIAAKKLITRSTIFPPFQFSFQSFRPLDFRPNSTPYNTYASVTTGGTRPRETDKKDFFYTFSSQSKENRDTFTFFSHWNISFITFEIEYKKK